MSFCCVVVDIAFDPVGSEIRVKSALYRPRCLPDGEVVVDSLHDVNRPRNCSIEISAGRMSSSVAALQASRSATHCGVEEIVSCTVYLD
jgi:hypothetical protein